MKAKHEIIEGYNVTPQGLPAPVKASNERSPNRKPRWKQLSRTWGKGEKKKLFLRYFNFQGDLKRVVEEIGLKPHIIYEWGQTDPAFKAAFEAIKDRWDNIAVESFGSLKIAAIGTVREVIEQRKNIRVAFEASKMVINKFIPDKSITEHQGVGGGPVLVVVIKEHDPTPQGEIVEGSLAKELPASSRAKEDHGDGDEQEA